MLKIAWNAYYCHSLPAGHRFPMDKYNLLPEQLLYEGTISNDNLFSPDPASEELVLLTHERAYLRKLRDGKLSRAEERRTGFPYSKQLVDREMIITGGTIQAAQYAREYGISLNVAGGTHHAYADRGEGFCLLNDFAVAANYLIEHDRVNKILIIDLDVHQGNGTACLFQDNSSVFTFSMHGEKNYPLKKERSDLDIALPDGTEDKVYLRTLEETLPRLMKDVEPEFVFYLAGVDILESDKLGRLSVSIAGCRRRDELVLRTCQDNGIPVAISMGGGYSPDIKVIIEAHANTFRLAQELYF